MPADAPTTAVSATMDRALAGQRAMLEADGYRLVLVQDGAAIVATITAGPEACADCLVPKALMHAYFARALAPVCADGLPEVRLVYPGD